MREFDRDRSDHVGGEVVTSLVEHSFQLGVVHRNKAVASPKP